MASTVIDTNVIIVATGRGTHASPQCSARCARALQAAQRSSIILDDTAGLILREYLNKTNLNDGNSPGGNFLRWFLNVRYDPKHVKQVEIGSTVSGHKEVIPNGLHNFDQSDLKFIAVYIAGGGDELLNATDSDWGQRSSDLVAAGVNVVELCKVGAGAVG